MGTRKRETNPQLPPSIIQAQKEYMYAFEPIVLSPMELSPTEESPTEESPKEAQESRKNRPWLNKPWVNKLRCVNKLRESKHKSPPSVSPPMTPRRLSPAPGLRKCDSPVLVRLLEEIEDAKRRS